MNFAPFYPGQKVVGSDKVLPQSRIKKGHAYTISACHQSINPANGLGPFWYVGVHEWPGMNWLGPHLFTAVQQKEFPLMSFQQIKETEKEYVLIDN